MFWFNSANRATKRGINADLLAKLRPFQGLGAVEMQALLDAAELTAIKSGRVDLHPNPDRLTFLIEGSLQLQPTGGSPVRLVANTPQTSFALPAADWIGTAAAPEPGVLATFPQLQRPSNTPPTNTPPTVAPRDLSEHLDRREAEAYRMLCDSLSDRLQELPSLPDLALKISRAIDNKDTDSDSIARLLNTDPTLATRILRVVNSAAFGGVSKITSTQQAVSRLGRKKVRSLVYSCVLKSIFKIQAKALTRAMQDLWRHSAHVAATCFVLGRQTPGVDPEQAMLAGLIHDIGAVAAIDAISRFPVLSENPQLIATLTEALRTELGLLTLKSWDLLSEFGGVVRDAEHWHRMGSAVPDSIDILLMAQMHSMIGTPKSAEIPRIHQIPAYAKLADGEMTPQQSLKLLVDADIEIREVQSLIGAD